jgi:hypothetical protein
MLGEREEKSTKEKGAFGLAKRLPVRSEAIHVFLFDELGFNGDNRRDAPWITNRQRAPDSGQ